MKYYCHWVCKYSYFNHNPPAPADVCVCKGGRLRYGLRENWKGRNRGGRDGTGGGRGELEKRKRKGRAGTKGRRWLGAGWRSWRENEWTDIPCCTMPSCLQMPRLKKGSSKSERILCTFELLRGWAAASWPLLFRFRAKRVSSTSHARLPSVQTPRTAVTDAVPRGLLFTQRAGRGCSGV